MKLLVKGDDYGITKSVTYGIIEAFDHGILTSSGMFSRLRLLRGRHHGAAGFD